MADLGQGSEPPLPTHRVDPPYVGDERAMLEAWLDYHRATLLLKCAGLDDEQLARRSAPPSPLSLLGLVRHLAEIEQWWFRKVLTGEHLIDIYGLAYERDVPFLGARADTASADLDIYRAEVQRSREAARGYGLDDLAVGQPDRLQGRDISLRWIYLHMLEEYARHNGHADLIRELIDGRTGT